MKLSIHENMFLDKYHKHAAFFAIPQRFMASQQPQPYLFSNQRAQQRNLTQTEMPQTKVSIQFHVRHRGYMSNRAIYSLSLGLGNQEGQD